MITGITLITEERSRQRNAEDYSPSHDDGHIYGELAQAAACYALPATERERKFMENSKDNPPKLWPWESGDWKPLQGEYTKQKRIRELVKAGALVAAEIDRLLRIPNLCRRCGHDEINHPSGCIICNCRSFVVAQ